MTLLGNKYKSKKGCVGGGMEEGGIGAYGITGILWYGEFETSSRNL